MFRHSYDANDRLTYRWTPAKLDTFYSYDKVGNLTNINYYTNVDVQFSYDSLNRPVTMVDTNGTTRFTYSPFGALLTEDGPWENDTVTYGYDRQKRSTLAVQQPNGSEWVQSYSYDTVGRLKTVSSPAGTFTYNYAGAGWLVINLTLPMGSAITNAYDSVGRLKATMLRATTGSILSSNIYIYDLASRRMTNARSSNVWTRYTYDGIGQLKSAWAYQNNSSPREHEKFGYVYDAAGNLQYRTNNAFEQTFNLNNLNQLTTVTRNTSLTADGTHSGPATSVTVAINGGAASAATLWADNTFSKSGLTLANGTNTIVAVASDALGRSDTNTSIAYLPSTTAFAYDANGNLTYDGQKSFEYDDENQLVRLTATNQWKSEFAFDGKMRRRVRREFTWENSAWIFTNEVRYVYDRNLEIQCRDALNIPRVTLTRGSDLSGTFDAAGGIGGLLARSDHSSLVTSHAYYHADGNGNIIAAIDSGQTVVASYAYQPFGRISSMSGPLPEANPYRFSSKEQHSPSDLILYRYRPYEANLQRWCSQDPLEELAFQLQIGSKAYWNQNEGPNLYTFVKNEPISRVDPNGLKGRSLWPFLAGLLGCKKGPKPPKAPSGDPCESSQHYKLAVQDLLNCTSASGNGDAECVIYCDCLAMSQPSVANSCYDRCTAAYEKRCNKKK